MANLCETIISSCIAANCDKPLFAGVEQVGYIANFSDIAGFDTDTQNGSIVKSITMKEVNGTAKCWYKIQQLGNRPYDGSQTEYVEGTYMNRVNHTIQFAVLDNGPEISENVIDNLLNGKFAVILQNDYVHSNGDNKYSVYGLNKGLKCTGLTRELWGDNESAWIVTLVEENSPKSGMFIFDTDEQTTDAMIEGLACSC